jgi:hypothetical protein
MQKQMPSDFVQEEWSSQSYVNHYLRMGVAAWEVVFQGFTGSALEQCGKKVHNSPKFNRKSLKRE